MKEKEKTLDKLIEDDSFDFYPLPTALDFP
jgi:hypothetical protein